MTQEVVARRPELGTCDKKTCDKNVDISLLVTYQDIISCFFLTRDRSVRPSQYFNIVFTCIFIIEAILRIIALRWGYFQQHWNVFDFVVVVLSIIGRKLSGYRN